MAERLLIPRLGHMRRFFYALCALGAVTAACTAAARAGSGSSLLGGNCGSVSAVFAPWSDPSNYYFASNGGFESGSTGWSLTGGAAVVKGNDAFALSGAGSHALSLGKGSLASINVCYGLTYPAVRFVVGGVNGPAVVHVRVIAKNLLGVVSVLDGGTFTAAKGWAPAPKLSTLFSALTAPLGTKTMQLQIGVDSGTALVDDLYIDPFLSKS